MEQNQKKTLILGASLKPHRASNQVIRMLRAREHAVMAVGLREGKVDDVAIQMTTEPLVNETIDTVSLYLNPTNQRVHYDFLLNLKPRRIIFNPGTYNPEFIRRLDDSGIESEVACTLVLLSTGQF